ncbi:MAG: acyltransferase family protein [Candidatus Binatia bacterium]
MAEARREARRPEIDWLKGFAILCVFLIHAQPLHGRAIQTYLIDRAVPIFVVLFGMTSERWWRSRASMHIQEALILWYRTRVRRLMIPAWATVIMWWCLQLALPKGSSSFSPTRIAMTALGYWPWIGTGWFVTLVILLVIVFPFAHLALQTIGEAATLLIAIGALLASWAYMFHAIEIMRALLFDTAPHTNPFFYFWIFVPAWLMAVTVGAVLTRRRVIVRPHHVALCVGLAGLIHATAAHLALSPASQRAPFALADPLIAIAMLGIIPVVGGWAPAASFFAWCGEWSWGIYLGQLLVHNALVGYGVDPILLSPLERCGYLVCLFVGAVGLAIVGQTIRAATLAD